MALMDTLYSPKAQYALGDASDTSLLDRSGNAEHLSSFFGATVHPQPDPVRRGFLRAIGTSNYIAQKTGTYLRTLGALTILVRGACATNAIRRSITHYGAATAGEISNTVFDWAVTTGGLLTYLHHHGAKIADTANSSIAVERGHERFFGLRRSADGLSITFSYGTFTSIVHETVTVANAPTGGTSSVFRIGGGHTTADSWIGGQSDFCLWHSELTTAQVEAFWAQAMFDDAVEGGDGGGTPEPTPVPSVPGQSRANWTEAMMVVPKYSDLRGISTLPDLVKRVGLHLKDVFLWIASVPRLHLRRLEIRGGALPFAVRVPGLALPPLGVVLLGCYASGDPSVAVNAHGLHWVFVGDEQVSVTSLLGLDATTSYVVTFLIVESAAGAGGR